MTAAHPWTRFYQDGTPAEIEPPSTSLGEMFEASVAAAGDAPATQFFGRRTSYAELGDQVRRVAGALHDLGVRPGDRVALALPNCPEHVVAFYAVLRLGGIVVEHNPLYTAPELRDLFADHGARVVIAWDSAVAKIQTFAAELGVETIVAVNLLEAVPTGMRLLLSLPVPAIKAKRAALHTPTTGTTPWRELAGHARLPLDHPRPGVEDLAVIQYTSGTTGRAKGVMLSHRNLFANARQGEAWMIEARTGKEVIYAVLPMFHAFGMTLYLTFGILKQGLLVLFPKPDVDLILAAAKKTPPTVYCAVPPIYRKTAQEAAKRGISLRSAKFCISGAMALTDDIVDEWENVSGGLLVEGYGMTESSPVALGNPFTTARRTGTIGIPFPSTDMKVVDADDPGREVTRGEPGELLLRGPQVFSGYWNNPEATAQTLLPGGWLRTGDIVTQDEDGFTTIVDRAKELIITGGFNVSPSEVEAVLLRDPSIADVAVVGRARPDGGEDVVAVVVPTAGAAVDAEQVRERARGDLARYKVPREVIVTDELPRSMLGKVLRKQVRDTLL